MGQPEVLTVHAFSVLSCASEKSGNAFLLVRLGLPSTLICQEKGTNRKTPFKPEEHENTSFAS